ncbi:7-carboxy-7-deazaguanine synthase QueE [Fulvivirga maritima]|uniref:7-carboxy-7-deazaguanine synthase QueE n=1 Tax=Fulvivirga maritima TaxID=2904247 RepID=UPI001F2539F8|nr:7-carboxy-7-deazaguanine synthase QueE [Fulvivirga maritima]UII25030.1 7-carboxy-7-deazaguanine synthase QueE [Fulvivirga maritima]
MKLAKLNGKAEIFHSIQGEGKNIGKPSIFVRTSLCNLHCRWCDTDYTWNWEGTPFTHDYDSLPGYKKYKKSEYIEELELTDIISILKDIPCKNLVLTGGEPLLQQTELSELMAALRKLDSGYWFETETNGTIIPNAKFDAFINQYNVSPKLSNSNNPQKIREKEEAYRFFSKNEKAVFKFVIATDEDLDEVKRLISDYSINSQKVYLMPEGTTREKLNAKQQWLIEECKTLGTNYTDRLHIHIYGNKRGV